MYVESLDFMYEKEWNAKNHDNKRHFKGENNKSTDNKNAQNPHPLRNKTENVNERKSS